MDGFKRYFLLIADGSVLTIVNATKIVDLHSCLKLSLYLRTFEPQVNTIYWFIFKINAGTYETLNANI